MCRVVTTHYDGACEQCLIRKDLPSIPVQHPFVAQPHERTSGHIKLKVTTVALIALLVVVAGFTHIVHGGGVGLKVCAKESWSLNDTFVDADEFIGKPWLSLLDRANVVRALIGCEVLTRPDFGDHRGTHTSEKCLADPLSGDCR